VRRRIVEAWTGVSVVSGGRARRAPFAVGESQPTVKRRNRGRGGWSVAPPSVCSCSRGSRIRVR